MTASTFLESSRVAPRVPFAYRVADVIVGGALKILFRFEISGQANVPRGPYIAAANHLNWLDAFALLIALPIEGNLHLLGWDRILEAPKLGWLIRTSKVGFIPVARDPQSRSEGNDVLFDRMSRCVKQGFALAIFPEGECGFSEGTVRRLKPGFARVAQMTGAPVLPVAISGTRTLWLRKTVRIVIGPAISPAGLTLETLVQRVHCALIEQMPPHEDARGPKLFRRRLTRLIPSLTNWTSSDRF